MHQCLLALFGGKMTVDSDSHDLAVSSAGQVQVLFLEERTFSSCPQKEWHA